MTLPDFIGHLGVALIVATYFLVQIGKMDATQPAYPAINGAGALFILLSLTFDPNWPSIVMEGFWLIISLIGLFRALRKPRS